MEVLLVKNIFWNINLSTTCSLKWLDKLQHEVLVNWLFLSLWESLWAWVQIQRSRHSRKFFGFALKLENWKKNRQKRNKINYKVILKDYVMYEVSRKDREIEMSEKTFVCVKNNKVEQDEAKLNEMFQKFGKISSVKVH